MGSRRPVDDAHAAAAELPEDLVPVREFGADQFEGSRRPASLAEKTLSSDYDPAHAGLREARRLLSGQVVRPREEEAARRPPPLRLARPGDARGLRRHDREREDRPLPVAHRGGRHRRRARDPDRPEGRPLQPAADVSRSRARGLPSVDQRGRRGAEGDVSGRIREAAGRALGEGPRRVGSGRRADPAAPGSRGLRDLHAGLLGRASRLDPEVVRGASGGRRATTKRRCASACPRRRPGCSRSRASRPIP